MDLILSALECSHDHQCLLCCSDIQFCEHKVHPEFEELFKNLFRVFAKYMKWNLPSRCVFNFKSELFPFCKACILVLVEVNKLDERIRDALKQIDGFTAKAVGKILLSEPRKSKKINRTRPKNAGTRYNNEKVLFCRNVTLQRYLPSVQCPKEAGRISGRRSPPLRNYASHELEIKEESIPGNQNFMEDEAAEDNPLQIEVNAWEGGERDESEMDVGLESLPGTSACSMSEFVEESRDGHLMPVEEEGSVHPEEFGERILNSNAGDINVDGHGQFGTAIDQIPGPNIWNPYSSLKSENEQVRVDMEGSGNDGLGDAEETGFDDTSNFGTFFSELSDEDNASDSKDKDFIGTAKRVEDGRGQRRKYSKNLATTDGKFQYRGFTFEVQNGRFKCSHCSYDGRWKSGIYSHILTIHIQSTGKPRRNRSYIRTVEVSKNQFQYGGNFSYSKVNGRYLCGHCPLKSVSGENVRQHIRRYHMGMELPSKVAASKKNQTKDGVIVYNYEKIGDEYKCGECGFTTKLDVTIRGHFRHKHVYNPSKYQCSICGKGFRFKSSLESHQRVHSRTRPFNCEFCGKGFKCDHSFKNHLKNIHSGDISDSNQEQLTCELCGKQFLHHSLLKVHLKSAHSIKPGLETFTCHICNITLPRPDKNPHMRVHINLTHQEEGSDSTYNHQLPKDPLDPNSLPHAPERSSKTYTCGLCELQCPLKISLLKHMKDFHGINQITQNDEIHQFQ